MRLAEKGEDFKLEIEYDDELGELGTVFKGMMEHIRSLNTDAIDRETELARSKEQVRAQSILGSIIDGMPDGVAIIDRDMRIIQTNPRHKEIFPQARVGEPCYFCIHSRDSVCPHCGLIKVFEDGMVHEHHSSVQMADNTIRVVHSISAPILDESGNILNAVEVVRDVTERVNLERELKEKSWELERANKKLAKMAVTDGLTMLFNRRYFQDSLAREFKRLDRHRALPLLALAMIDLDNFKNLNDTYGHQAGDQVLRAVGKILKATVRMTDIVARYGGEEFVVIMPETDKEGMVILAERIRSTIEETEVQYNDVSVGTTVSIGLASFPSDNIKGEEDLIRSADDALYRAKATGKNKTIVHEDEEW
jgi:diguanylate cyclase (GGDEF)-like protein/PAS domain S-box-containing protein